MGGGGSKKRLAMSSFSSEVAPGVAARDVKRLVLMKNVPEKVGLLPVMLRGLSLVRKCLRVS